MLTRVKLGSIAAMASGLLGCQPEAEVLPPYGEVLVEIDTDLAVPKTLDRVRIDLFGSAGLWLESRDFAVFDPNDFPLSFSVYNESFSEAREMLVRVRGYAEGRLRDYRGERFEPRPPFQEPPVASTLAEACSGAPRLLPGEPHELRFRTEPPPDGSVACDGRQTQSGLAAFRLEVSEPAEYRIEVTSANPSFEWSTSADPILSLRTACANPAAEITCADNVDATFAGVLPSLTRTLEPGLYSVVVGNRQQAPMDVTLLFDRSDRFGKAAPPPPEPPGDSTPRLIVRGLDVSPPREPLPSRTVDRLARIRVEPERVATARLTLSADCTGVMADLFGERSCVDGALERVDLEPLLDDIQHSESSAVGSWPGYREIDCAGQPKAGTAADGVALFDEQVCIPGGAFVLGDPRVLGRPDAAGTPERLALIPPFFMDRYEYTVGRYRAARRRGFVSSDITPFNRGFDEIALVSGSPNRACTYNEMNLVEGFPPFFPEHESLPLNCVSWRTARALCQLDGGDLPTVAQREYAATAAGRPVETAYPWGDETPDCRRAVWGRWIDTVRGSPECGLNFPELGKGPVAVDAEPWVKSDVTPQGVVGLGGGVAEWTLDSHRGYAEACWTSQPIASPRCFEVEAPQRTLAGAAWRDTRGRTRGAQRTRASALAAEEPSVGFRCVYPADGSRP
jgi:formylglycine-generating enzyme required for sulfatase activity